MKINKDLRIPVTTDIHSVEEVGLVKNAVGVIQIPHYLVGKLIYW